MSQRIAMAGFAVLFALSLGYAMQQPRNARAILTETPPPADAKIAYGKDPNQFGELRLPQDKSFKKPYPVAVILHGGCWMAEYDLGYLGHASADLAAHGIATWNLEYRRIGNKGGGWPGTFEDVVAGTKYLTTLAQKYPLDLQRVIFIGHSAGGHLALLLGAQHKQQANSAMTLRGVISLAGITDLRRTGTACDANVPVLMNGPANELFALYDSASPLARLPLGVKQIIVQGEADRIIPAAMATSYVEVAKKKGDDARLVMLEKVGHFELVDPQSAAWDTIRKEVVALLQ